MRGRAVLAATLAAASAIAGLPPAVAQDPADKARLDDFALPSADRSTGVQQLSTGPRAVPAQPKGDRDVSVPRPPAPGGPLVQVAPSEDTILPVQRDPAQARSARGVSDLSARRDSAPGGVTALAGRDACDPQHRAAIRDPAEAERCRRILELRSAEFDAPAPPVLSAEQRIIAEQQRRDIGQGGLTTPDMTARALARATDAESRSSQELAAVVLASPSADQTAASPAPERPEADTGLSDLLQALVVQLGGQPSP